MIKKYPNLIIGLICLLPFLFPMLLAGSEVEKEVIALGMADGISAQSRDIAINDALRQAVQQGVGTYISSETVVEQMKLIQDRIYSETKGYIKKYKILKESKADGIYEIKISALVKMDKLAGDLEAIGLILRKKQNPRVMVVIYSKETNDSFLGVVQEGNRQTENQIESVLLAKGFIIVDASHLKHKKALESFLINGDPSLAGKIAKDYGAEILVEGEVRRKFIDKRQILGGAMNFFSNNIRLKAFETDTSRILFSGYKTRPPSGGSALIPLEEATSDLVEEMLEGILNQWKKDVYQAGTYQLNLSGASYTDISLLKKALKKIRGLSHIQTRSFQSGHALLEVKFQGSIEELAEKIADLQTPALNIHGLQSNSIEMMMKISTNR